MEYDDIDNMICDLTDVANTLKHHRVSDEMLKQYPHFQEFRLRGGTLLDLPKGDGGIFTIGELLESVIETLDMHWEYQQ